MEDYSSFQRGNRRLDAPPGEVYFGAKNPGELGFYINSRGAGFRIG